MRLPVDNWESWYIASGYGDKRETYIHQGADVNLKTGGDTDLGQPIFAIADGEVTSTHNHSGMPTFGNHVHIQHDGPWGRIWCHYAHCQDIFIRSGDKVIEGQKIATLGKSGTQSAHLHFCIKKEPTGVDGIAKTLDDLKKWTDPIQFVLEWARKTGTNMEWLVEYFRTQFNVDLTKPEGEVRGLLQGVVHAYKKVEEYKAQVNKLQKQLEGQASEIGALEQRLQTIEANRIKLDEELKEKVRLLGDKETFIFQLQRQLKDFEGKVAITEEEYLKLTDTSVLKRYTKFQLIRFALLGK